ncbi:hypothetical protein CP557_01945 [Natrinema ejinorense]|uniref:Uncharacterized protein n=1 Tax=Natrinema ejinorense TaxID=373386 RepID=A0A2A5QRD6_9EURY|nr:hypothetical protein CP557_01945 [Natrinema ejinorense]
MRSGFVQASELYDVDSRTPIAHPAHQATDEDVRQAFDDREIRADGGHSSSGIYRLVSENTATNTTAVPTIPSTNPANGYGYRPSKKVTSNSPTTVNWIPRIPASIVSIAEKTPIRSKKRWSVHTGSDHKDGGSR